MDKFTIEVLKDGTIKVTTGAFSDAQHMSAEEFLAGIKDKLGGEMTSEANHERDLHTHHHDHDAQHERQ